MALLVHGLFNAAIAKEEMGPGFTFHQPHDHGGDGAAYWCVLRVLFLGEDLGPCVGL